VQVGIEGVGDAKKRVDPRRPPAALEASDRRLGGAYELGEIGLGEAALLAAISDLAGDLREQPALLGAGEPCANSLHGLTHISIMLYIAVVRYWDSIAVGVYLVAGAIWLFWIVDQQVFFGEPMRDVAALSALAVVHLLVGLTIGRWWALFLPFVLVFLAIPLAYPDPNRGEPFPVWFGVLFWMPAFLFVIAMGVGVRKVWERKRSPAGA
jgi:hypothetical protein